MNESKLNFGPGWREEVWDLMTYDTYEVLLNMLPTGGPLFVQLLFVRFAQTVSRHGTLRLL